VIVSDSDLAGRAASDSGRRDAAEFALAALLVLLLAGPLLDWRRLTRSGVPPRSSRSRSPLTDRAPRDRVDRVRKAGLADFSLLPQAPWTPFAQLMFASPLDFLLNALVVAAWSCSPPRALRCGARPVARVSASWSSIGRRRRRCFTCAAAAGLSVAALVLAYEWFLRTHVSQTPVEIVRFSLGRLDLSRVEVIVGLIALNASVVGWRHCSIDWPGRRGCFRPGRGCGARAPCSVAASGRGFFGVYSANDAAPQWPSCWWP
jgi:hypothetical protein